MAEARDSFQELIEALDKYGLLEEKELAKTLNPEEQSLWEQERLQSLMCFVSIADQMPGGFFIYQAEGEEKILYANRALVRLFGCQSPEEFRELTGNTFKGMVHPDDLDFVEASIWEQIAESQYDLDYVEYRIIRKDGEIVYVQDYGHFMSSGSGGVFYVFVAEASGERRRLLEKRNQALEDANEELRRRLHIIEGFSIDYESILYVDLEEDRIQPYLLSSRTEKLKTLAKGSYEETSREYLDMWVHPEDREIYVQAVAADALKARLKASRVQTYHVTYRVIENGEVVYLELRVANVSGSGPVSKVVLGYRRVNDLILQEMEQREVLEDALRRSNAAIRAKNTFLSNMSHDIRTPMNAMAGYTELARRNLTNPEKLKECLDKIEEANRQMLHLIGDVLLASQLEGDSAELREMSCCLSDILHTVENHTAPLAEAQGVSFSVDISGVVHDQVVADRQKLEQILLRLTSNAVKYAGSGGTASVTVTERGAPTRDFASYCFQVADTGIGIEEEFLSHIFEPFERRKNTTESGMFGLGLGLTIAKSMVEMMGGTLEVESQVAKGSVFTVTIPLQIHNEGKHSQAAEEETEAREGARRILLVEDNEINRELYAELLEGNGFRVDTAENGREAVDKIAGSQPGDYALVLMDIQMPVMDGNTAARTIRSLPDPALAGIPIVALSANALEEDRKKSMESGMNAHVAKPVQIDELVTKLREFMEN